MFNINGIDWEIKFTSPNHPKLQRFDGTYAWGACDGILHTIYISEAVPMYKLQKVLCHEITHAAMFSYHVKLDLMQEELVADLIATYGTEIVTITNQIFSRIAK